MPICTRTTGNASKTVARSSLSGAAEIVELSVAVERGSSSRDYSPLLTEATGVRYDPRNYLSDMDGGFYSADYLRAWIRSAQLRRHLIGIAGEEWWRSPETGQFLREL